MRQRVSHEVLSLQRHAQRSCSLSMLPVTSGGFTSSGRDKSVLSTAIKQLRRRFGRKFRRLLRKHRLLLIGLVIALGLLWWFRRAVRVDTAAPNVVSASKISLTLSLGPPALVNQAAADLTGNTVNSSIFIMQLGTVNVQHSITA